MRAVRRTNGENFGTLYDSMQTSAALYALVSEAALLSAAGLLLGKDPTELSATGHMLRMDSRDSKRNQLAWHQESSYYRQNINGDRGIVCWIPMFDITLEHGPVVVCPGSHKAGNVGAGSSGKGDYGTSEQYEISADIVDQYERRAVLVRGGDALLFHMDLFHRSGDNESEEIRFAAGVRFHTMTADDFLPGRMQYVPNPRAQERRKAQLQRMADLRAPGAPGGLAPAIRQEGTT
jgi:ectoine hydroxylase-related dioxygenase (phytanoyl-CoA dioxygenase family)